MKAEKNFFSSLSFWYYCDGSLERKKANWVDFFLPCIFRRVYILGAKLFELRIKPRYEIFLRFFCFFSIFLFGCCCCCRWLFSSRKLTSCYGLILRGLLLLLLLLLCNFFFNFIASFYYTLFACRISWHVGISFWNMRKTFFANEIFER